VLEAEIYQRRARFVESYSRYVAWAVIVLVIVAGAVGLATEYTQFLALPWLLCPC